MACGTRRPLLALLTILFWVSSARATDDDAQPPQWRLRVTPGAYSGVAFLGEKTVYGCQLDNLSQRDREVEIRVHSGTDVGQQWDKTWSVSLAAGQSVERSLSLPTGEIGYLAIRIQVCEDGHPIALKQEISPGQHTVRDYFESGLMVVTEPPSYGKRDPLSYFGIVFMEDFEATDRLGVKNIMPYPNWGPSNRHRVSIVSTGWTTPSGSFKSTTSRCCSN